MTRKTRHCWISFPTSRVWLRHPAFSNTFPSSHLHQARLLRSPISPHGSSAPRVCGAEAGVATTTTRKKRKTPRFSTTASTVLNRDAKMVREVSLLRTILSPWRQGPPVRPSRQPRQKTSSSVGNQVFHLHTLASLDLLNCGVRLFKAVFSICDVDDVLLVMAVLYSCSPCTHL